MEEGSWSVYLLPPLQKETKIPLHANTRLFQPTPPLCSHTFGSHPVQISTEKCLFQRNNSVTIPGPNETVDRLDQGPACSLPGHHILISSVMLYLTPQTRCTITAESSELLGGSL